MSFGLRDKDWVDPDEERPPEGMECRGCWRCEKTPDRKSDYGFCTEFMDWVKLDCPVIELSCNTWEEKR